MDALSAQLRQQHGFIHAKRRNIMRFPSEYLISHGWLLIPAALIGILLLAAGVFVLGGFEENFCSGFSYFTFVDQKAAGDGYTIQLLNGNTPVMVTGVMAGSVDDDSPLVSQGNIQPGSAFIIRAKPLAVASGQPFSSTLVRISYDIINGESGLTDSAVCAGRVG